jgi:hypothetical protein
MGELAMRDGEMMEMEMERAKRRDGGRERRTRRGLRPGRFQVDNSWSISEFVPVSLPGSPTKGACFPPSPVYCEVFRRWQYSPNNSRSLSQPLLAIGSDVSVPSWHSRERQLGRCSGIRRRNGVRLLVAGTHCLGVELHRTQTQNGIARSESKRNSSRGIKME